MGKRKIITKINDNCYEEREVEEMSIGSTLIYAGMFLYVLYKLSQLF